MFTRSKLAFLTSGLVLGGLVLAGGAALSQKTAAAPSHTECENLPAFEKASGAVNQVIASGHWTTKDHDQVLPLLHFLHSDQKIEVMRRVAAAVRERKLVVAKDARLFF